MLCSYSQWLGQASGTARLHQLTLYEQVFEIANVAALARAVQSGRGKHEHDLNDLQQDRTNQVRWLFCTGAASDTHG
jgi:hypothetical protein